MKTWKEKTQVLTSVSLLAKFLLPVILVVLALAFSGSTISEIPGRQKDETLKVKKLVILEKLENGLSVSSEDIRDSFGSTDNSNMEGFNLFPEDLDFIVLPEMPDLPAMPDLSILPDFSNDYHNFYFPDCENIVSRDVMKTMRDEISRNMEEMRKSFELFRNSQEYMEFMEEMKRFSEELRDEMDRMRDETRQSVRIKRSGSIL